MGWNTSMILVNERGCGYFSTFPQIEPDEGRRLIQELGLGPAKRTALTTFDRGLESRHGWYCVGTFSGAAILTGISELILSGENPQNETLQKIVKRYPAACICAFDLSSVSSYFACSLFENGELLRSVAGDSRRGVFINSGNPTDEEVEFLKSEKLGPSNGEGLVFSITARFFGVPLDRFRSENLTVQMIKPPIKVWPFNVLTKRRV